MAQRSQARKAIAGQGAPFRRALSAAFSVTVGYGYRPRAGPVAARRPAHPGCRLTGITRSPGDDASRHSRRHCLHHTRPDRDRRGSRRHQGKPARHNGARGRCRRLRKRKRALLQPGFSARSTPSSRSSRWNKDRPGTRTPALAPPGQSCNGGSTRQRSSAGCCQRSSSYLSPGWHVVTDGAPAPRADVRTSEGEQMRRIGSHKRYGPLRAAQLLR